MPPSTVFVNTIESVPIFGASMEQLCLDLEANLTYAPDDYPSQAIGLEENDLEENATDAGELQDTQAFVTHDGYIRFALDLLLTCAEDLVSAEKILSKSDATPQQREDAIKMRDETILWLRGEVKSLFSFKECVELLENELAVQSRGQVDIPNIANHREHLSQWIVNDPSVAKNLLSRYRTVFYKAPDSSYFEKNDDPALTRNRSPRGMTMHG